MTNLEREVANFEESLSKMFELNCLDEYTQISTPVKVLFNGRIQIIYNVAAQMYEVTVMRVEYTTWEVGGWEKFFCRTAEDAIKVVNQMETVYNEARDQGNCGVFTFAALEK